MADDRYQQLKPPQITAAVASFPRRYRDAVAAWLAPTDSTPEAEPLDAHTVALVNDTVRTMALCDRAIEVTLSSDEAVVPAAVGDASLRDWPTASADDLALLIDELEDLCTAMAARLGAASGDDWGRTATLAQSQTTTQSKTTMRTTEIAQEAVRTAAENLLRL